MAPSTPSPPSPFPSSTWGGCGRRGLQRGADTGGAPALPAVDPAGLPRGGRRPGGGSQAQGSPRAERGRVAAQRDALRLSTLRYEGGVTSFLEVLITERDLFDVELVLAQSWRDEILAVVQLYKVLGGGWQTETPPLASTAPPALTAALEPRPRNVGASAAEGGTAAAGDPAGVRAAANGAGAENGGPAAGGGSQTMWGSVKAFFGSLFTK